MFTQSAARSLSILCQTLYTVLFIVAAISGSSHCVWPWSHLLILSFTGLLHSFASKPQNGPLIQTIPLKDNFRNNYFIVCKEGTCKYRSPPQSHKSYCLSDSQICYQPGKMELLFCQPASI